MKQLTIIVLSTLLITSPVFADNLEQRAVASRAAVQQFSSTLKSELKQAIQAEGPVNGIVVCHHKAPKITAGTSQDLDLQLGRTSLKVRNPDNAPDAWELAALNQFEARKTKGEDPTKLEFFEIVEQDGKKTFRYMKAIPTAKVCLACHGADISEEVSAKLNELYPDDAARGFKEGDLRGAFSITQSMQAVGQ